LQAEREKPTLAYDDAVVKEDRGMDGLKKLRTMAGWTQTRTARASGIHRAKLSLAETGELELSPAEAAAVRRVLLAAIREQADRIQTVLANASNELTHAGA
jgi:transcriptional regulator with XRE-family HTH domain